MDYQSSREGRATCRSFRLQNYTLLCVYTCQHSVTMTRFQLLADSLHGLLLKQPTRSWYEGSFPSYKVIGVESNSVWKKYDSDGDKHSRSFIRPSKKLSKMEMKPEGRLSPHSENFVVISWQISKILVRRKFRKLLQQMWWMLFVRCDDANLKTQSLNRAAHWF